jgi:antitoxin component of RelBE/YafQ-DinJ toxin-antitoxin module
MMASKTVRVVSYISQETYAELRKFMEQQELTESQAIDAIISDRLGTATLPTDLTKPSNAVSAQGQTPKEKGTHSSPPKEAMSQKALAERLRCDSEHLASIRDYPIVLADYTRERDPDSMAWEYKSDSQLYFPLD